MTLRYRINIAAGIALAAAGLLALPAEPARAGDAAQQAATAAQHATLAAQSESLETVHAHLQHAINCLVGPDGEEFDASAFNPCDGMGEGALADAEDDATAERLESALEHALEGLDAEDIAAAREHATAAADLLKQR